MHGIISLEIEDARPGRQSQQQDAGLWERAACLTATNCRVRTTSVTGVSVKAQSLMAPRVAPTHICGMRRRACRAAAPSALATFS
jgi:hypothetical protein